MTKSIRASAAPSPHMTRKWAIVIGAGEPDKPRARGGNVLWEGWVNGCSCGAAKPLHVDDLMLEWTAIVSAQPGGEYTLWALGYDGYFETDHFITASWVRIDPATMEAV